jgi:DNA-binding transcriptional LysR family regulator
MRLAISIVGWCQGIIQIENERQGINLFMVNLEWYRSFLAVYRAGTVSNAARTLFLTQPAVTQHLAALEATVGEPLFTRTARQMVPTTRGKELYCQVVQALDTLEQVEHRVHAELPTLRLGSPLEYFSEVALEVLVRLPYRLWLQFGEARTLIEDLERDKLDVVIATQQIASRDVEYHKLGVESFQLVGSPELSFPKSDAPEEEQSKRVEQWLSEQKWISYGIELPIIRRFWQQCFGKRPPIIPAVIIPNLHAIAKALAVAGAMSVLPDYLCREAISTGRLCIVWEPPQKVTNDLWIAYRKPESNNAKIKHLRTLLKESWWQHNPPAP